MKNKKPTKEELIALLREQCGNMAAVGRRLHVDRRTVWSWVNADPELQQVVEDETESFIDQAESVLFDSIRAGNVIATIFFLKTRARHRGYSERFEFVPLTQHAIEVEIGSVPSTITEVSEAEALNSDRPAVALLEQ